MTQGFFTFALEKRLLAKADPARGRFRSFHFWGRKLPLGDDLPGDAYENLPGHSRIVDVFTRQTEIDGYPADHISVANYYASWRAGFRFVAKNSAETDAARRAQSAL